METKSLAFYINFDTFSSLCKGGSDRKPQHVSMVAAAGKPNKASPYLLLQIYCKETVGHCVAISRNDSLFEIRLIC